jgi:hypothetical protein
MVVRRQAALPKQYIYNAAILGVFVVGGAIAFRMGFETERVIGCAERANLTSPLPVTRSGGRVSLIDLRARSRGPEWGLDENLAMRTAGGAVELKVAFKGEEGRMLSGNRKKLDADSRFSGVGFDWEASALSERKVGCLSYSIQVAKDFPEASAGILPGLVLAERTRGSDVETTGHTLSFPIRWYTKGRLGMRIERSDGSTGREFQLSRGAVTLAPGQWHAIEQEITLNTPGKPDGGFRVWLDGELVLEQVGLQFFKSEAPLEFRSVAAHVHFVDRNAIWTTAPKATEITLRNLTLHGF